MFILLAPERIVKIPREAAVARTRRPRGFVKNMLTIIRIEIIASERNS